uniref:Fibronectin type-III domain-containing protein n=1 Tax=Timema genevievae TaxID=629358 RepID=A0A7R9JW73_TIMGE|nr:unnamed protein product [Timema genevievae]
MSTVGLLSLNSWPGAGVVSARSAPPPPVGQPPTPSRRVVSCYNTPMAMLASTHSHEQEVNSISEKKNALREKLEQLEERAAIKSREMMELKQTVLKLQQQQDWQLTNVPPPTTPKVDPSLEGIKAAMDNILVKCRTKDQMITAMADELNRQRRSSAMERVLIDVATDKANMVPDFDRARLHEYLQCPRPRTVPESAQHETPGFPKGLAVLRRINPNTLLLGWDPPAPTITGIIGYDVGSEVYVNGNIQERVRSATRNRTLLHGLDLTRKLDILVYAVTPKGKFADPAFVSYQDTVDRPRESGMKDIHIIHPLKPADGLGESSSLTLDAVCSLKLAWIPGSLRGRSTLGFSSTVVKRLSAKITSPIVLGINSVFSNPGSNPHPKNKSFLSEPHGPMPMIQRYQHGGIPHKVVRTSELCSRVRNEEYEPRVRRTDSHRPRKHRKGNDCNAPSSTPTPDLGNFGTPNRDSNLVSPRRVVGSSVYCESSALDHGVTEAGKIFFSVAKRYKDNM